MKTREDILEQACLECLTEMYAKAQPSLDFKQYLDDVKLGKVPEGDKVYERHFNSVLYAIYKISGYEWNKCFYNRFEYDKQESKQSGLLVFSDTPCHFLYHNITLS